MAAGLLTQRQVDEALQNQLLSGGTIGTSLLDLGHIDEDDLGAKLAELTHVGYADRARLQEAPEEVTAQLPRELAEKHLAVPIGYDAETKTLEVAAVHPMMLATLSRVTGFKIVAWVAPEVRIYEALESYYGVTMRPRYARIVRDLDARRESHARKVRETVAATVSAETAFRQPAREAPGDSPEDLGYGRDWRSIAAELDGAEPAEEGPRAVRRHEPPRRIEDVWERFCEANFKEELAEATLDYLSTQLATCILFRVRGQLASGWDWRGAQLDAERVKNLRVPVGVGSIFALLLGRSYYHGPVGDNELHRRFHALLRLEPPQEILLLPVYVQDRLVTLIYGDNAGQPIEGDVAHYRSLAEKLAAAFNLLILKMKIRA